MDFSCWDSMGCFLAEYLWGSVGGCWFAFGLSVKRLGHEGGMCESLVGGGGGG